MAYSRCSNHVQSKAPVFNVVLVAGSMLFPLANASIYDVDFHTEGAEVEAEMEGMLVYYADAALFIECSTGERFPVLQEESWPEVEQAYLDSEPMDMAFRHVAADVRLTWLPAQEAPSEENPGWYHAVFTGQSTLSADRTCGNEPATLLRSSWEAAWLYTISDNELAEVNPPWLQLRPDQHSANDEFGVGGNTGCNAFGGEVALQDNELAVLELVATRLYCVDSADVESAFLEVTDTVSYSGLEGEQWVWYDSDLVRLAEFLPDTALADGNPSQPEN